MSAVGQRLAAWRAELGQTQAELAKQLGIHVGQLKKYEQGRTMPGGDVLAQISTTGVSVNWLLTGLGPMRPAVRVEGPAQAESADTCNPLQVSEPGFETRRSDGSALLPARFSEGVVAVLHAVFDALPGGADQRRREYAVIPTFNEPARAGTPDDAPPTVGAPNTDLAGLIAIDPALIRRQFACEPADLCHIQVAGHSMSPTLEHGDAVLINRRVDKVTTNGIYVLQIGGTLLIKRVQIKLDGSLVIGSDNPAYAPETVPPAKAPQLSVVGLMVWPRVR